MLFTVLTRLILLIIGSVSAHYTFAIPGPSPTVEEQNVYKLSGTGLGYGYEGSLVIFAARWNKVSATGPKRNN